MHKSQLCLAAIFLLSLVFSSVDAIPCRYCSQSSCRAACLSQLQYCYDYKRSHKTKDACLTYYYICGASCAVVPKGIVNGPPTDEISGPINADFPPTNDAVSDSSANGDANTPSMIPVDTPIASSVDTPIAATPIVVVQPPANATDVPSTAPSV